MNNYNKIVILILGLVLPLYLIFAESKKSEGDSSASNFGKVTGDIDGQEDGVLGQLNNADQDMIQTKELLALENMVELISIQIRPTSTLKRLYLELRHRGLEPIVLKDSNPYTGTMHVVRTEAPLPGTRYFHAQYMSDNSSAKPFLQHMSFEFRPGQGAKEQVIAMIRKKFPNIGKPETETGSFTAWRVNKDYLFWVKKMGEEDLTSDEYNAYTVADAGTIRVGMEWDVHAESQQASHNE